MVEASRPQTVITRFFSFAGAGISTRLHFMPAVCASAAPTDILCGFSIFGRGIEPKRVVLDGAKSGQPDGVRLEDAFPALKSQTVSGVIGVEMEISSSHPRLNLLTSQLFVEIITASYSVIYSQQPFFNKPVELEPSPLEANAQQRSAGSSLSNDNPPQISQLLGGGRKELPVALAFSGSGLIDSSLIIINSANESLRPTISRTNHGSVRPLHCGTVSPMTVLEVPLNDLILKDSPEILSGEDSFRAEALYLESAVSTSAAYYMVYRASDTRNPVSVLSL